MKAKQIKNIKARLARLRAKDRPMSPARQRTIDELVAQLTAAGVKDD